MISLSKGDIFPCIYCFTVYFLNLYLLFNLDAPSPVCVYACVKKRRRRPFCGWPWSLLAALFLSFTVPGEFDHVVLLLLLLLG